LSAANPRWLQEAPLAGEHVSLVERIVVSPCWGRLRAGLLAEGDAVSTGAVIGHLEEAGEIIPLVSHAAGAFVRWLAWDGQRVAQGRPVALIRSEPEPLSAS
jgi:biotin carboxyl carrier protein